MSPRGTPKTLRELVGAYWGEQCLIVLDAAQPLRDGADVVHRTRVAVRRARSTLRVYADLFEPGSAQRLDEELRWWAAILGRVRDLEVLERRLEQRLAALPTELVLGPVRARLAEAIASRAQPARSALAEALNSPRYRALDELVRDWHRDPPFTAAVDRPAKKVGAFVTRAERQADRRLHRARRAVRRQDGQADALVHAARKAVKRHRYALEVAQPVSGKQAGRFIERCSKLQTRLGEHQDAVVAATFLWELATATGSTAGSTGFTWGVLYAGQRAEGARVAAKLTRRH